MLIEVNGTPTELGDDPQMPLLWALRDIAGLTGTKYGCGIAQCGACTVLVDGLARRSCVTPIGSLGGASVTTIEGLSGDGALSAVQTAWIEEQVPQCGYCQSGQIMTATALLDVEPNPDDAAIDAAFAGNLCRCGTYPRIRAAVKRAAGLAGV